MSPSLAAEIRAVWAGIPEGYCPIAKAIHLGELVDVHKPEIIVELGILTGRSFFPMALAGSKYGAQLFAVDPWELGPCLEGTNDPVQNECWKFIDRNGNLKRHRVEFLKAVSDLGLSGVTVMAKHDSEVLGEFKEDSIGLLHVDSNHSEEVSLRTVKQWSEKVKPGGFLVLDDLNWGTQKKTVEWLDSNRQLSKVFREDYGVWRMT